MGGSVWGKDMIFLLLILFGGITAGCTTLKGCHLCALHNKVFMASLIQQQSHELSKRLTWILWSGHIVFGKTYSLVMEKLLHLTKKR